MFFTSSCFPCGRRHLRPEIWPQKTHREVYPHFACEPGWVVSQAEKGAQHHRITGFLSFLQGNRVPLFNSQMCFDSFWSWKETRGLPLCLLEGQSCRLTVWKWKAKQACFRAKCFSSESSRPLFKLSKSWASHPYFSSYSFLFLSTSAHPSSLCLRADAGVDIYQAEFWQTVGCTPQDVGSVERCWWIKSQRFYASRRNRLKYKDGQDDKSTL